MDSDDLTAEQLERIHEVLGGFMNYLVRLKLRMEENSFPDDDRLFRCVKDTHEELHKLLVHLHYQECDARRRERSE